MELRENGKRDALDILFAALAATLATLLLVLVFALIVRWTAPGDSALLAGNCAIRVIAVAAGVLIAFRRPTGGAAKGLIAGVLYYLVTLLVLSAADGFKNAYFSAVDLICSAAGGAVAGVLAVNLKGRRRRG